MFFTLIVLLSGVIFLLILLPFTFVRFFYAPWLEAQQKALTPRKLPGDISGHIIITSLDPVTENLIRKLEKFQYQYTVLEPDQIKAQEMHERGYKVVMGDFDDPETYKRLRLNQAALVVATNDDLTNTSIAFTIRELSEKVPIVTNADNEHSIDILEYPGNTHVFEFMKMLGQGLARRTQGLCVGASILGNFGRLVVAEIPAAGTSFEGKTLVQTKLRKVTGLTVVGLWERGKFATPLPDTVITSSMVLVLAGKDEQIDEYNRQFLGACNINKDDAPVLILGGGRVGHAAAQALEGYRVKYTIVDKRPGIIEKSSGNYILGDAADINTLRSAGIEEARTVLITTHHDAMNIYLAFYCRKLRPEIQIISRAMAERTVSNLYRAGADLVISSASLGANSILNFLRPDELSMFTEGLDIFSRPVPSIMIGTPLVQSRIREVTGCNVIAINRKGEQIVSPDPETMLQGLDELILVGTTEAEAKFLETYK